MRSRIKSELDNIGDEFTVAEMSKRLKGFSLEGKTKLSYRIASELSVFARRGVLQRTAPGTYKKK